MILRLTITTPSYTHMTIYFLTPDYSFPSGGVRVIYQHVDILNAHGIQAYVLHNKPGFRCDWFENTTSIAYLNTSLLRRGYSKILKYLNQELPFEMHLLNAPTAKIGADDYLVLPEIDGPNMINLAPGVSKVILNQNCYLSFQGYSLVQDNVKTPYDSSELKAVLTNSTDGENFLNYVFPQTPITRFHLSIDPKVFPFQAGKKRQICFTPRKNELLVRLVINILKSRNVLNNFELVPFAGISQSEVSQLMQDSAIFLSFGLNEGFGLPPAEAMACGCIVIGFHAGGGREFFNPEFSFPIESGDVLGFSQIIEQVIQDFDNQPEKMTKMSQAASEYVLSHYSKQQEENDIVNFWQKILVQPPVSS